MIRPVGAHADLDGMSASRFFAPPSVLSILIAELRKALSLPAIGRTLGFSGLVLLAAAVFVMYQVGQFQAQGRGEELGGLTASDVMLRLLHYGQVIPILLGCWVSGQDLPVGSRRIAFLATARRTTLFGAKLLTTITVAPVAGFSCVIACLVPLGVAGGGSTGEIAFSPYWWLLGYWVVIAVVTTSLVAATRSTTFTVVPILVWTIGLSDLLSAQFPALSGALDQVFKYAYLQGGATPPATALAAAAVQIVTALLIAAVAYARRDVA